MTAPLVTVVIPAYNAAAFIERTLDTVRAQTFTDYEIVVIDDGSTDATQQVVDAWLARHKAPGRCIRQPNGKIAAARNAGMRAARGRFIALLDHDDLWKPEKLAVVMEEFQRHPDAELVCHNEDVVENGKYVRTTRNGPACVRMYERLLFKGNAVSPSAAVFLKDKALSIGGMRENPEFNTVEDYDFWMRLSKVARYRFIDRVLGEYQLVERRASRSFEYHYSNQESLLRDHFATLYGGKPGWCDSARMARRLSTVYRSALGELLNYGENPGLQKKYALRMLRACPWDPRNIYKALRWTLSLLGRGAR